MIYNKQTLIVRSINYYITDKPHIIILYHFTTSISNCTLLLHTMELSDDCRRVNKQFVIQYKKY